MARRSPPKLKCRPAPVSTTARTAALRAQVMAAASRSMAICRLMVLAFVGRLSVTTATAPRGSTCTVACDMALLVRRDPDAQAGKLGSELELTRQPRVGLVVRELGEQLALIGHHGRQALLPLRIDIDVTGCTRAHAAADGGDPVVELAQVLHDLQAGLGVHLVLDAVTIDHAQ